MRLQENQQRGYSEKVLVSSIISCRTGICWDPLVVLILTKGLFDVVVIVVVVVVVVVVRMSWQLLV